MNTRQVILVVVLIVIAAFGYLTIKVAIDTGVDILVLTSLLVLALFGVGIVGALRHPPEE
jgi:hypothetical protein